MFPESNAVISRVEPTLLVNRQNRRRALRGRHLYLTRRSSSRQPTPKFSALNHI